MLLLVFKIGVGYPIPVSPCFTTKGRMARVMLNLAQSLGSDAEAELHAA